MEEDRLLTRVEILENQLGNYHIISGGGGDHLPFFAVEVFVLLREKKLSHIDDSNLI